MNAPEIPDFLKTNSTIKFTSDRVTHFFKMWELLKHDREFPIYVYDDVEDMYVISSENDLQATLLAMVMELDQDQKKLVFSERDTVTDFFKVVVDQPAFWTPDHVRFRNMLIDWYSTQRAIVTKSRKAIDPYSLSNEELDSLILGFGYPYPYEVREDQKSVFLHELIGYYQRKGTPKVLGDALSFYGLVDSVLCEWWVYHDFLSKSLWVRSQPVWPRSEKDNPDYVISRPYEAFVSQDPFWHYDKDGTDGEQLLEIYREPENPEDDPLDNDTERLNKITLPSLTPYITLNTSIRYDKVYPELSILNRKMQESYEYWLEYILKWKGSFATTSLFPENPDANWVVFSEQTETHYVYNGREWVNLGVRLPSALVESEPTCLDVSEFEPIRDVALNVLTDTSVSLLEAMLGSSYMLSAHFGLFAVRAPAVSNWDDLLNLPATPENNEVRLVSSTQTDAIFYGGEWHDLEINTGYDSTDGNFSLIAHIPPDSTSSDYFGFRHLEYHGRYSPLDSTYTDGTNSTSCKDGVDDADYKLIIQDWDDLHIRPTDVPSPSSVVGIHGAETKEFDTAWKKRQTQLSSISDSFYRQSPETSGSSSTNEYELMTSYLLPDYESIDKYVGWVVPGGMSLSLSPDTTGFTVIDYSGGTSDSTDMFAYYFPPVTGDTPNTNSYSGPISISFDYDKGLEQSSPMYIMARMCPMLSNGYATDGTALSVLDSGHYDTTWNCSLASALLFSKDSSSIVDGTVSNLSIKLLTNSEAMETYDVDEFFSDTTSSPILDGTNIVGFTTGWFGMETVPGLVDVSLNVQDRSFSVMLTSDESSQFHATGFAYLPFQSYTDGTNSPVFVKPIEFMSQDAYAKLSFEVYNNVGFSRVIVVGADCIINSYDLTPDSTNVNSTFSFTQEDGLYEYIINLRYCGTLAFYISAPSNYMTMPGEVASVSVRNIRVTPLDSSGAMSTSAEHFVAYSHVRPFLKAMNPILLDAIDAKFYLLGLLYPTDLRKLTQAQEGIMQDIGVYLKNELGLNYLLRLSTLMMGLTMYKEIKKVINFLKPYRARFKSMMTEYSIDNPVADGEYIEDHLYMPRITQKNVDVNNTFEDLSITPVLLFEEALYRYPLFDRFKNHFSTTAPGVYSSVFDGINRPLDDRFFTQIRQPFYDTISVTDKFYHTSNELFIDDSGAYSFDAGVVGDGYPTLDSAIVEAYDASTGRSFNYISAGSHPELFLVSPGITTGVRTEDSTSINLSPGFYEIDLTTGDILECVNWSINENDGSLFSADSTNALAYVIRDIITNDAFVTTQYPSGIPLGYVSISCKVTLHSSSGGLHVSALEARIDDYDGNPNAGVFLPLSDGDIVYSIDYVIPEEFYNGCAYVLCAPGDGEGGHFSATIELLEIKSVSWTNEPFLRVYPIV